MARTNQRGRNNNNPHGRNQYTNQFVETAKDHPFATAAAVAGAVGAGVYLWSKRHQVSNQVNEISRTANEMSRRASQKASDWLDQMKSRDSGSSSRALMKTKGPNESDAIESSRATGSKSRKTNANMNAGRAGAASVSY